MIIPSFDKIGHNVLRNRNILYICKNKLNNLTIMKKALVLAFTLCCFISCGLLSKNNDNPYMNAYRFIVKDMMIKKGTITVKDSLLEFDRYLAESLLKDYPDSSFPKTVHNKQPNTDSLIHHMSIKASKPKHLLLFSNMENNMIMAEIVDCHHFTKYGNDRFTTNSFYLFVFDDKMRIKKVSSFNMQIE